MNRPAHTEDRTIFGSHASHAEPAGYLITRWLFLRLLGVAYLIAFGSLAWQLPGLIGADGILPAEPFLSAVAAQLAGSRFFRLPTLFWFGAGDGALNLAGAAGIAASLLLIFNRAPLAMLAVLWALYLSFCGVGRIFLAYQWDVLLLEVGLLAIFMAPWGWRPGIARDQPARPLVWWMLRWLLFRFMFESGLIKLASGDPTWRAGTALEFHYFTQPLPTPLAWYAYQLPDWTARLSVWTMFAIELILPILIFGPRPIRRIAFWGFVLLQSLIALTGNYGFFNLLTVVLCFCLVDDRSWPDRLPRWLDKPGKTGRVATARRVSLRDWIFVPFFAAVYFVVTGMGLFDILLRPQWPAPLLLIERYVAPFRSMNSYGLFAVMTTQRHEIVIEGSNDGVTWHPFEFPYKPGQLDRPPPLVAPYQPRLDWQMWFAALGDFNHHPWVGVLMHRLLTGSPAVIALFERDPFAGSPPRFIRARRYDYHFTTRGGKKWWRREYLGPYGPILSRADATRPRLSFAPFAPAYTMHRAFAEEARAVFLDSGPDRRRPGTRAAPSERSIFHARRGPFRAGDDERGPCASLAAADPCGEPRPARTIRPARRESEQTPAQRHEHP